MNGLNQIYLGDCLEIMKRIPDQSIDMILCDLPYGATQNDWDAVISLSDLWAQYKRIRKPNAAIVLNCAQPFTTTLIHSNVSEYKYSWVWKKSKPTGHLNAKKQPMRNLEDIAVFYKEQCQYNPQGTKPTDAMVSRTNRGNYGGCSKTTRQTITGYPNQLLEFSTVVGDHQTQKPVPLFEYLIRTYTTEGHLVLDNCIGSGTTAIAAINTGRNWIGIEKDPGIYAKAVQRVANHGTAEV